MRTSSPPLLPLFRSRSLAEILAYLFINVDDRGASLSAIAKELGVPVSTVQREVERLERAGILRSERWGRLRLVRPDPESPYFEDLRSLLLKAFGPKAVLKRTLATVTGVDEAFIFGSWARTYLDGSGPAPADIDVLVVGEANPDDVYAACSEAAETLGREVNPTIVSRETWRCAESGFIRTVRARPLVELELPGR